MQINNPLSNLFGRSPFKPIEEHMAVAVKAARELPNFFTAIYENDWEQAEKIQQQIVALEHEADQLKKELRLHLPKSLFLPVPRTDLLELLTMQDKIANKAKDIAGIMLGRQMCFPKELEGESKRFVGYSVATAEQALKAINELDELLESGFSGPEIDIVEKLIEELDELENTTDSLEVSLRASLFKLEEELPPVHVMFLYKVIDWTGDLADKAQGVGARLQQIISR